MATLKTVLKFDGSGFTKGMKQATAGMKNFQKSVGTPVINMTKNLGKMALAATAAAAALATMAIVKLAGLADAIGKASTRMGIGVEAVQQYQTAAERGGAALEDFEKGILFTHKTILEAREGNELFTDTLKSIGVSLEDLEGLSPDKMFDKILLAVDGTKDATVRATAAMQLLGKSGLKLLPMAKTLEAIKKRKKDTIGIFSEKTIKNAEKFNDLVADVKDSLLVLFSSFIGFDTMNRKLEQLVQYISKVRKSQAFKDFATKVKEAAIVVSEKLLAMGKVLFNFVKDTNNTRAVLSGIIKGIALLFSGILAVSVVNSIALMTGSILSFTTAMISAGAAAGVAFLPLIAAFGAVILVGAVLEGILLTIQAVIVSIKDNISFGEAWKQNLDDIKTGIKEMGNIAIDQVKDMMPDDVKKAYRELKKLKEDLAAAGTAGTTGSIATPRSTKNDLSAFDLMSSENANKSFGFSNMYNGESESIKLLSRIENILISHPEAIARESIYYMNSGVVSGGF